MPQTALTFNPNETFIISILLTVTRKEISTFFYCIYLLRINLRYSSYT